MDPDQTSVKTANEPDRSEELVSLTPCPSLQLYSAPLDEASLYHDIHGSRDEAVIGASIATSLQQGFNSCIQQLLNLLQQAVSDKKGAEASLRETRAQLEQQRQQVRDVERRNEQLRHQALVMRRRQTEQINKLKKELADTVNYRHPRKQGHVRCETLIDDVGVSCTAEGSSVLTGHTKQFRISSVPYCKRCHVLLEHTSTVRCVFHQAPPLPYKGWDKQLSPYDGLHHAYMLWPCCGQVGKTVPPGCTSCDSHQFTTHCLEE